MSHGTERGFNVDLSVLVDIISNAAGMMILFACMSLLVQVDKTQDQVVDAKPIDFPLSYLPTNKSSVIFALKNGRFYRLPDQALFKEVIRQNRLNKPVANLTLEKDVVLGAIQFTQLGLGYRFYYRLLDKDATRLNRPAELKAELDDILKTYPKNAYYVTLYCWPDEFAQLQDIREYLIEQGMVVSWHPRFVSRSSKDKWDIVLARGDYDENFTTIKAQ